MPKAIPKSITSLIDPNHPVINTLGRTFGGYLPGRRSAIRGIKADGQNVNRSGVNPRVDIVDEKLCDDVLEYLAPTLEPYKGCTIIDAHPGACIWSQKLNDFLKPKRHILMEPEERYIKSFIQPLLDKQGSTFKHTPLAAVSERGSIDAFKTALADEILMPIPPSLRQDDPRRLQLDTSVLVTGNLARLFPGLKAPTVVTKASPQSHMSLQDLTRWSSFAHQTFHSQGLVRMLWWIPDQHKSPVIPHIMYQNSTLNVDMQMGAQLTEVVGVEPATTYLRSNHLRESAVTVHDRMPLYDEEISMMVRRKMDAAGIKIPKDRPVLKSSETSSREDTSMRSPIEIHYHTVKDLKSAIRKVRNHWKKLLPALEELTQVKTVPKVQKIISPWIKNIEYPQCVPMARYFSRHYPNSNAKRLAARKRVSEDLTQAESKIAIVMDLNLRIINLEAHFAALADQGHDVTALKEDILQLDTDIHSEKVVDKTKASGFIQRSLAEQLAFFSDPPILPYDRRPYEPLKASLDSFWPRYPLALLDVVPTGRDLAVPGIADRYEAIRTTAELIKYLFTYKTLPLPPVLDKIAPNAAQDLIPQVPALADPRKGGRLNPNNMTVRMLSEEMIEGLVRAWFEWPFKPRLIDLALSAEAGAEEAGGAEEEGEGEGDVAEA